MAAPHRTKIRELRLELALSRKDLAREVGYGYAHIANIENGHGRASEDCLATLAVYFSKRLRRRIRVTDLVGEDEPKPDPKDEPKERRAPTPGPEPERPYPPPRPPGPGRSVDQAQAVVA